MESKSTIVKIDETNNGFYEKINNIDKSLPRKVMKKI